MKKIATLLLAGFMVIGLSSCNVDGMKTNQVVESPLQSSQVSGSEPTESQQPNISQSELHSYQSILDEYSQKIRDAVPALIEECNEEAANNTDGLQGLAILCNEKVSKLAEISNEGVSKMADYYF